MTSDLIGRGPLRKRRTTVSAGTRLASFAPRLRTAVALTALAAGLVLLLGGCGGGGSTTQAQENVALLSVGAPLREPLWVKGGDFTVALREDQPRVARFGAGARAPDEYNLSPEDVAHSEELDGVGENLAVNLLKPDELYLPQPDLDRVALINTDDLRKATSYEAGEAPEWVTVHKGSQTLFALSEDGSMVAVLNLEDYDNTSLFRVEEGKEARIKAPEKGLEPEFWIWGPDGIAHYSGFPPERKVGMPINAGAFAPDLEKTQRAYVGEATSSRVLAVEGDPQGLLDGELEVMAEQDLGERAEHVEAEELRVFAATRNKLFQMRRDNLDVLETVEFRSTLAEQSLGDARISGMAVAGDRIYLTLEGEPYILSIEKTNETVTP